MFVVFERALCNGIRSFVCNELPVNICRVIFYFWNATGGGSLEAGLSRKKLEIDVGLDPSAASTRINRCNLGIHKVDYTFATRLAEALKVPVVFIYAEDPELAQLILLFRRLSRRKRPVTRGNEGGCFPTLEPIRQRFNTDDFASHVFFLE